MRTSRSCQQRITVVTITPVEVIQEFHNLCFGESLGDITESGSYYDTLRTSQLCDSIITLREVNIAAEIKTEVSQEICEGSTYEGYNSPGIYSDLFESENGCDSMRILDLVLSPTLTSTLELDICQGDSFELYSENGLYIDTLTSMGGCDSIRTVQLIVSEVITEQIQANICAGTSYEGYSESGLYSDTFTTSSGCDSIRVLQLEVSHITESRDTIFLCPWEEYQGLNAPNAIQEEQTTQRGCDSIVYTDLVLIDREDITCSFPYDTDPHRLSDSKFMSIWPNPTSGNITLEILDESLSLIHI